MNTQELIDRVLDEPTCYPEEERKDRTLRRKELLEWHEKYHEVNICYNLYGMDRVSSKPNDEWLDRGIFRKQRHDINGRYYPYGSSFPYDYTLLMRDKQLFETFMSSVFGDEEVYCHSLCILMNKTFYHKDTEHGKMNEIGINDFICKYNHQRLVFKNTFGFGGSDICIVELKDKTVFHHDKWISFDEFLNEISLTNSFWLVQSFIKQHPTMSMFNDSSVNTMRILTYHNGNKVVVGKAVLRFGKKGSKIDNCDQGGNFVSVNESGMVGKYQFNYLGKTRSKCDLEGMRIPYYKDAEALIQKAHSFIPQLFTVGWDVVITENGPLILEGNDGWDPYLTQAPAGHEQRRIWNMLLEERKSVFGNE